MPIFRGQSYAAFLFDMDGTMLDSSVVVERVWAGWAERHGLNATEVLAACHGVRAEDLVRRFGPPNLDVTGEVAAIQEAETADIAGVVAIEGIHGFVESLSESSWAIVTSAPRALAEARLHAVSIPLPRILIAAEDVARGKPDPEGFVKAAEALGFAIDACLVFEDSPAGIAAAKAAGAQVAIIGERANISEGDYVLSNYR